MTDAAGTAPIQGLSRSLGSPYILVSLLLLHVTVRTATISGMTTFSVMFEGTRRRSCSKALFLRRHLRVPERDTLRTKSRDCHTWAMVRPLAFSSSRPICKDEDITYLFFLFFSFFFFAPSLSDLMIEWHPARCELTSIGVEIHPHRHPGRPNPGAWRRVWMRRSNFGDGS